MGGRRRHGKLTPKIDPDVDHEREYIRESLMRTALVAKADYVTPADPVIYARTAHGEKLAKAPS